MAEVRPSGATTEPQLSCKCTCGGCSVLLNCCLYPHLLLMGFSELYSLSSYMQGTTGKLFLVSTQDTLMADDEYSTVSLIRNNKKCCPCLSLSDSMCALKQ